MTSTLAALASIPLRSQSRIAWFRLGAAHWSHTKRSAKDCAAESALSSHLLDPPTRPPFPPLAPQRCLANPRSWLRASPSSRTPPPTRVLQTSLLPCPSLCHSRSVSLAHFTPQLFASCAEAERASGMDASQQVSTQQRKHNAAPASAAHHALMHARCALDVHRRTQSQTHAPIPIAAAAATASAAAPVPLAEMIPPRSPSAVSAPAPAVAPAVAAPSASPASSDGRSGSRRVMRSHLESTRPLSPRSPTRYQPVSAALAAQNTAREWMRQNSGTNSSNTAAAASSQIEAGDAVTVAAAAEPTSSEIAPLRPQSAPSAGGASFDHQSDTAAGPDVSLDPLSNAAAGSIVACDSPSKAGSGGSFDPPSNVGAGPGVSFDPAPPGKVDPSDPSNGGSEPTELHLADTPIHVHVSLEGTPRHSFVMGAGIAGLVPRSSDEFERSRLAAGSSAAAAIHSTAGTVSSTGTGSKPSTRSSQQISPLSISSIEMQAPLLPSPSAGAASSRFDDTSENKTPLATPPLRPILRSATSFSTSPAPSPSPPQTPTTTAVPTVLNVRPPSLSRMATHSSGPMHRRGASGSGVSFQAASNPLDDFDAEDHLPPLRAHMQAPRSRFFIDPDGVPKVCWSLVLVVLIVYSLFEVPLSIGFGYRNTAASSGVLYFIDSFFVVDVFLNFLTGFHDDQLELVTDMQRIARQYLRGWFVPDTLGSIPFELIALASGSREDRAKVFLVLRALKIPRLLRVVKLTAFLDIRSHRYLREGIRMVKLVFVMIIMGHWVACGFMLVARSEGDATTRTWAEPVRDHPLGEQYVFALYWSLTVLSTVGFGDIGQLRSLADLRANATGSELMLLCVVRCLCFSAYHAERIDVHLRCDAHGRHPLCGQLLSRFPRPQGLRSPRLMVCLPCCADRFLLPVSFFCVQVVVGNVMLVLGNLNASAQRHTEEIMKVGDYMRSRKFPPSLQQKVFDFTEAEWKRMQGYDEREIIAHLPQALQIEVARHLHAKMLQTVSFFQGSHAGFINEVVLALHTTMLLPG